MLGDAANHPLRVAVTGGQGFLGSFLISSLLQRGYVVYCLCRENTEKRSGKGALGASEEKPESAPVRVHYKYIRDICDEDALAAVFREVDFVVHLAARAHKMHVQNDSELAEYDRVNHLGTLAVAKASRRAGVKRVVFISSIKVNGEQTFGKAFTPFDTPAPQDEYARSKMAAENVLKTELDASETQWVIVRPPLIYGPNVKGNLVRLQQLIKSRLPLPLMSIHNKRSLVGVPNLCDFIARCLGHPQAAGQTFLVADGKEGMSTPALIKAMSHALGLRPFLIPVPEGLLKALASWTGKSALYSRLCGDLNVDISFACTQLQWMPPFSVSEQMGMAFGKNAENVALLTKGHA
ncbi:MAG: NAD-dependent epimerase/dehydratase family protein [Hahellaceae bacterium]|nr:NAD-dependent epimerase/dehydratase family protein [Hahellaceae bacterium]